MALKSRAEKGWTKIITMIFDLLTDGEVVRKGMTWLNPSLDRLEAFEAPSRVYHRTVRVFIGKSSTRSGSISGYFDSWIVGTPRDQFDLTKISKRRIKLKGVARGVVISFISLS